MPYIRVGARDEIAVGKEPTTAGELNYVLTKTVLRYIQGDKPSYQRYNDAVGALECAKLELYRRAIVPYEDQKIAENGDVYPEE